MTPTTALRSAAATSLRRLALGAVVGMAFAASAGASAIVNVGVTTSSNGFAVSNSDLLNGRTGVVVGNLNSEENLQSDTTGAALTDGGFGGVGIDGHANPGMVQIHSGTTITYTLAGASTISAINTFAGWRDAGRYQQDYVVGFAYANDPTTYLDLFSVGAHPTDGIDSAVNVTGINGAMLGSNVVGVRFTFAAVENGFVGYRELDVIGTRVPEPASLLLFGLGALALAGNRRKQLRKGR